MISFENQVGEIGLIASKRGYLLYSCAFCRGGVPDFEKGERRVLPVDTDTESLGRTICELLNASRRVAPDDPIFNGRDYTARYDSWFAEILKDFGVKTKNTFFKNAKSPLCRMNSDEIEFRPTVQERVGGFSSFPKTSAKHSSRLCISRQANFEEVGQVALESIALCE